MDFLEFHFSGYSLYRNAVDFCILIYIPAVKLNSLISLDLRGFFYNFLSLYRMVFPVIALLLFQSG